MDLTGIDSILNAILVNEDVRPAMLVQPADNHERTGKDTITKTIIARIKDLFPNLIQSENYKTYQGIIISKTEYNGRNDISLELMGDILGYPCSKEFNTINRDVDTTYGISITATLTNGKEIHLFANVCKDETKIKEFNASSNKKINQII